MDLHLPRWSLAAWFHFRERVQPRSAAEPRVVNPHYSVTIFPGLRACAAVKAFTGVRYLASDAPRLPLAGCPSKRCTCKYVHHCDRRAHVRRAPGSRAASVAYGGIERRKSGGRRATDV